MSKDDVSSNIREVISWVKTRNINLRPALNFVVSNASFSGKQSESIIISREIGVNNADLLCPNIKKHIKILEDKAEMEKIYNKSNPIGEDIILLDFFEDRTEKGIIYTPEPYRVISNIEVVLNSPVVEQSFPTLEKQRFCLENMITPINQINVIPISIGDYNSQYSIRKPRVNKQKGNLVTVKTSLLGPNKTIKLKDDSPVATSDVTEKCDIINQNIYLERIYQKFGIKPMRKQNKPVSIVKKHNKDKLKKLLDAPNLKSFSIKFLREFFFVSIIDSCIIRIKSFT